MRIRRLLKIIVIPSFLMGIGQCQPASSEHSTLTENTATLPNIVYILVDDLGYGDLSSYGQETLSTPHIDRLAKQGMRFTQHYAGNTVCAPSRASLLTGKHPGHVSVRGNQPAGQLLRPEETTLAEVVVEAGYASLIVGKWGVGHPPAPDDPLKHGFDHAYGYINMWHAHNFYPEFLYEDGGKQAVREGTWKGIKLNVSTEEAPVFELYQLDQDPDESDNVAERHPGVVKRLEAYMQSAHKPFEHLPLYYEDISEKTP